MLVGLLEGLRGTVEVVPHAVKTLDGPAGTLVELGVGGVEGLAGAVGDITAVDQRVDELLQSLQLRLDLLLPVAKSCRCVGHLVIGDVQVCAHGLPSGSTAAASRDATRSRPWCRPDHFRPSGCRAAGVIHRHRPTAVGCRSTIARASSS